MALASEPFDTISFGFNASACFLRIDPVDASSSFHLNGEDELVFGEFFQLGQIFRRASAARPLRLDLEAVSFRAPDFHFPVPMGDEEFACSAPAEFDERSLGAAQAAFAQNFHFLFVQ